MGTVRFKRSARRYKAGGCNGAEGVFLYLLAYIVLDLRRCVNGETD